MAQAPKAKPPKAEKPAAAKEEKKSDNEKALSEKPPPENPAVAAILETKPTTPEECVRAAKLLFDFDRADLAKGFLKKALDANLDQQQLADLGEQIGTPVFFDLRDRPALQPEAKQLADAVAAAVKARLEDSQRIAALIQQLQDPSAEKRLQAIVGLQKSGEAAVAPLIAVLADPARAAEHANVRAALAEIGPSRGAAASGRRRAGRCEDGGPGDRGSRRDEEREVGVLPAEAGSVGQERSGGARGGRCRS